MENEMTKTMSWAAGDVARPLSAALVQLLAAALQAGGDVLTRAATRLHAAQASSAVPPVQTVEFHAFHRDAGAPEGALYVNGELVGIIDGVSRL